MRIRIQIELRKAALLGAAFLLLSGESLRSELAPTFEENLSKTGARLNKNPKGEITEVRVYGEWPLAAADFQKLGTFSKLEKLAVNVPPAGDEEWKFLEKLPELRSLTIWHGKEFSHLGNFSNLPDLESLTIGGCMGIRDLNKETPEKQIDAILMLRGLPSIRRLNLYHSPTLTQDRHLAHLAKEFPKLEDLKTDFAPPRGAKSEITATGIRALADLPLKVLHLENLHSFGPKHMESIASIPTLEAVLIDARRGGYDPAPLAAALRKSKPGLEVVVALEGTKNAPRRSPQEAAR